jgi:hypothetical protein
VSRHKIRKNPKNEPEKGMLEKILQILYTENMIINKENDPLKPFDRSHPLPLPADTDFWEDRVKAGADPDGWRGGKGCAKGCSFGSEALFADHRRELEKEARERRGDWS